MSHLADIGFAMELPEFSELVLKAAGEGETIESPNGHYIRWSPGGGAELWVQATPEQQIVGCNPHFAGRGRMRIGVVREIPNPDRPYDGGVYGWADPKDEEPESGLYPFIVDLPDFDTVRKRLPLFQTVEVQIAAFAREIACYVNDAAFASSGLNMASRAVIPQGMFSVEIAEIASRDDRHQALVRLTGEILSVEQPINPATGQMFYALSVHTHGGTVDVVTSPDILNQEPMAGGTIYGEFWLSGRIVSELPPTRRKSVFQKRR
jgi:hypothetical protein